MIRGAERPYDPEVEKTQREVLGLAPDAPVAIYAGNTQKWQNIDLMIEVIARCGDHMYVIILSSAIDDFRLRLRARGIDSVLLYYATQDELYKFYSVANYGFLLRDDNIVNNVANPTKLVEYLKYGIVPVVITTKTSDLKPLEVETLQAQEMGEAPLIAQRSFRNIEVFNRHYCENNYLLSKVISGDHALLSVTCVEAAL
jgi:hypothetical protein